MQRLKLSMNLNEQRITDLYEEMSGVKSWRFVVRVENERANKHLKTWASWLELKTLASRKYEAICPSYDKQEQGARKHLDVYRFTLLLYSRITYYRCQRRTLEGWRPYSGQQETHKFFKQWSRHAKRSNHQPIKSIVYTFKRYLKNVLHPFTQSATSASNGYLIPWIQVTEICSPGFLKFFNLRMDILL